MGTMIFDITPPIRPSLGVFPGDTPFSMSSVLARARGASVNLSCIHATLHLGAHADAPWHYDDQGADVASVALDAYWGLARVIRCAVSRGARVLPADLEGRLDRGGMAGPWRCLIATGTFPDPDRWNPDFAALSPELIRFLSARGCILVGIDTPSVDPEDSQDLPSHRALAETGMRNLEGLVLEGVPEGWYELVALPLRLEGADGSPVRAALRPLPRGELASQA